MSGQGEASLILIRQLADGTNEWIPFEPPLIVTVDPGEAYAVVDRSIDYETPQTLETQRVGDNLLVKVQNAETLVLAGFFTTAQVGFHPTTDIAGGAGPFTNPAITPDSPVLAASPQNEATVWSAEDVAAEPAAKPTTGGGGSPLLWGGLAVAGLGLAAAAGGGGGGGGSSPPAAVSDDTPTPDTDNPNTPDPGTTDPDPADNDTTAPVITSGATAAAIEENSGSNQVVYTATATDAGVVTYALSPVGDAAAFEIDPDTGAVTLLDDPDYEAKPSYAFTVVASDDAGNVSEQVVILPITDQDEIAPTVTGVSLSGASGARNGILNSGDRVETTVTTSESVDVDISAGVPRIALTIGDRTVYADYVSGSGTTNLVFRYVVQPGDTDTNGISIPANALAMNGGSMTDAAGNGALDVTHAGVTDNASYRVDTTSPVLSFSRPADDATGVAASADIVLFFSEDVQAGSGTVTVSSRDGDTRIIDIGDRSQISINGNQVTVDPTADLDTDSIYEVQVAAGAITDLAGNTFAGISGSASLSFETEVTVDTSIVVFDLEQGSSSGHSNRTFQSNVSYDIYILVDSNDASLSNAGGGPGTWGTWQGAANLGSNDRIILVGDGAAVQGLLGPVNDVSVDDAFIAWSTNFDFRAAELQENGSFIRRTGEGFRVNDSSIRLFGNSLPDDFLGDQEGQLGSMYLTDMPAGILTSQGLV